MTPAGTSIDVQNGWEENTHTHARLVDVSAGVTQEEGHTGFLIHLPSAVLVLIFLARRIQPFLSLVDREVEFCVIIIIIIIIIIIYYYFRT